jgi:hypothetical protein
MSDVGRLQSVLDRAAERVAAQRTALEKPPEIPKSRNGKLTGRSPGSKEHWFEPGQGGRKKGTPNKLTRILREAILLGAEQEAGSLVAYLRKCARLERKAYLGLLGKLLPLQVLKEEFTNATYHSLQEVNVALNGQGLSLDLIERMKKENFQPDDVENLGVNYPVEDK